MLYCASLCWLLTHGVLKCVNMCWPVLTQWRRCRRPTEIHREADLLLLCCSWWWWRWWWWQWWWRWWWWWPTPAVLLLMIRLLIDRQGCVEGCSEEPAWCDDIDDSRRYSCFLGQRRQCKSWQGNVEVLIRKRRRENTKFDIKHRDTWQWSVLSWFEDTGTACCQGGSNLERKTFQLEQKG